MKLQIISSQVDVLA